ncbi:site-specific recombinase [Sphaerotilus hippei]|uniref:Site-specific recombinase n=1 Tax=Sphaerotilus hippei TaxID=744406 RepID=A0A318GYV8_9BURK|nr:site-specific recombinase [Sphaerotilus hippei]PXW92329.1 site-specific recombinase [Sphaerotilus hippei]
MIKRLSTALTRWRTRRDWDLTSLLNAASTPGSLPERHLWLIRLAEWLRSAPPRTGLGSTTPASPTDELPTEPGVGALSANPATPWPVRRLRHLLNVLERHPEHARQVRQILRSVLSDTSLSGLLADFGFAPRTAFASELAERLRLACLPGTPETEDLGELFQLVFDHPDDAHWLEAVDSTTLQRLGALLVDEPMVERWRLALFDSIQLLASQVRATAMSPQMRQRIDADLMAQRPFYQLASAAEQLEECEGDAARLAQQVQHLRTLLPLCRQAAASVRRHLEAYGISVDVVFQARQMQLRCDRIDALLTCLVSTEPARDWQGLVVQLAGVLQSRRGLRRLFSQHYSLLARLVTERNAETGEHYITRTGDEYRDMLWRACGGGLVIAGTTFLKFFIGLLGFTTLWAGFWAGINYAGSFVLIHLLHWTVATKQPAMTAPAMAAKLDGTVLTDEAIDGFVDEVAHLIRSQIAGIVGNLMVVVPVVLALQALAWWMAGAPLISATEAHHALEKLTLPGPTLAYAAFTGVLLFASSLIAGWVENWFVWHRLDSAIAWNPRFVRLLGAGRAQRWSRWWRDNISGIAANVSLGLMLGMVPALASILALPVEVRHVTLSTGQIAAALGTLKSAALHEPLFWWSIAAIPFTGALNLLVSFLLAFKVALRSRGLKLRERGRLYAALRERLRDDPASFLRPPRTGPAAPGPH